MNERIGKTGYGLKVVLKSVRQYRSGQSGRRDDEGYKSVISGFLNDINNGLRTGQRLEVRITD
jgi:hypothetical protein